VETPPFKDMPMPVRPGEGLGPDFDVTTLNFDTMLELFYITLNEVDERTIRTSIEVSKSLVIQLVYIVKPVRSSTANTSKTGWSDCTAPPGAGYIFGTGTNKCYAV
jgi:hypothetical protein